MKRFIISLFLAVMLLPAVNAQFTKIGGGVGYGTGYWFHNVDWDYNRSGHFAAFLEGIYEITVPLHVTGRISYFYPHVTKDIMSKITVSSVMFDINGHYVFNSLDKLEFYALAGANFLITWKKDKIISATEEVFTENDNAFGLNIGAGACFKLTEQFDIFAEAKYILATNHYSQFMANAGVLINIDWLKKHENE
ncbi:MAG: porin family protein [Bacteroidales bacterium]|jgi:opacity protein-like surface antigen|nr:porin family protein [Bacteroidales bacterium]